MGSLAVTKAVLSRRKNPAVSEAACLPANEVVHVHEGATWLQITSALGAAASHSWSDPHSSDSKWLKLMWRNSEGLMSFETASRISACIPRSPVWKSKGSSSFTRKWLNCKLFD